MGLWMKRTPPEPVELPSDIQASLARLSAKRAAEEQRQARLKHLAKDAIWTLHLAARDQPIRVPDADGAFPAHLFPRTTLVVVDANTLRNDVIYSCRHAGARTTLLTGANGNILRLFCAKHVLEEVHEHYLEWCEAEDVSADTFVQVFKESYAPLLRAVWEVPEGLLSANEQARVDELRTIDPDDIPSVTLAIVLEAFYMSEDLAASRAVYGREVNREEAREWVEVLRAGGDAGMAGTVFQLAGLIPTALGAGIWEAFNRLTSELKGWARFGLGLARGITGAAEVLRADMTTLADGLRQAGLNVGPWLDEAQLSAVIRTVYDPGAAVHPDDPGANLSHAGPMAVSEHWDRLRHDTGWSSVLWIAEWPRIDVPPDFLHSVVFAPEVRRSLSIVARPLPTSEALRQLRREKTGAVADMAQKAKVGQLADLSDTQEYEDLLTRERSVVAGHTDVEFSGFVTVTAPSPDALDAACASITRAAAQAACEVRPLCGRQAQGFVVAALPLARRAF